MDADDMFNLAIEYGGIASDRPLGSDTYYDMADWFKEHGGTMRYWPVFSDLVHLVVQNRINLKLSDAYMGMQDPYGTLQTGQAQETA